MSTQVAPVLHCHLPSVVGLDPLATTTTAAMLFGVEPFAILSLLSEKLPLNRLVTLAPVMFASSVSSSTAARDAVLLAVGASFTAVIVVSSETVVGL